MSMDEFRSLLKQAELDLSQDEAEKVKELFERFAPRLAALRAADLEDEEVAGIFSPSRPPEG